MRNRWFVFSFSFLLGCLCGLGNVYAEKAAGEKKVISAEEFVLVGPDGKPYARIALKSGPAGAVSPFIALLDSSGGERLVLAVNGGIPSIEMSDERDSASISAQAGLFDGEASVAVRDKRGCIAVGTEHYSKDLQYLGLTIWDNTNGKRAALSLAETGFVGLNLYGNKNSLARMDVTDKGIPSVSLMDGETQKIKKVE